MNINKIGGIGGKYSSEDFPKVKKGLSAARDSVNFSEVALSRMTLKQSLELVRNAPNIRAEKVLEAKNNLGSYFSEGNINSEVTEKIAKQLAKDMWEGLV